MAAGRAAAPAHTHAQPRVPKLGFSIRRLLSGVPCVVNGDREIHFQGVIQRLGNCLDMGSLESLPFPRLSFFIIVINAFHIHYNGEHWQSGGICTYGFWQLLSFCSVSS